MPPQQGPAKQQHWGRCSRLGRRPKWAWALEPRERGGTAGATQMRMPKSWACAVRHPSSRHGHGARAAHTIKLDCCLQREPTAHRAPHILQCQPCATRALTLDQRRRAAVAASRKHGAGAYVSVRQGQRTASGGVHFPQVRAAAAHNRLCVRGIMVTASLSAASSAVWDLVWPLHGA